MLRSAVIAVILIVEEDFLRGSQLRHRDRAASHSGKKYGVMKHDCLFTCVTLWKIVWGNLYRQFRSARPVHPNMR
jgi:hypothetical protein